MTRDEPPLWRAILARLDPPPESTSIDSVTEALGGVVGRGTIQRIRQGVPGTSMESLNRIAKRLGCSSGELLGQIVAAPREPEPAQLPSIRIALTAIRHQLMQLHGDEAELVGDSLKLMATAPDSDRVFENAVALLNRGIK